VLENRYVENGWPDFPRISGLPKKRDMMPEIVETFYATEQLTEFTAVDSWVDVDGRVHAISPKAVTFVAVLPEGCD